MTDRRLLASNGRVAAKHLKGQVQAGRFVTGEPRQVSSNVLTIWRDQEGSQKQRELLYGDGFLVLENTGDLAFGQSLKDGYVGYVDPVGLQDPAKPSHRVVSRNTHLYARPDIKSAAVMALTFDSRLTIVDAGEKFMRTNAGTFIPANQIRALDKPLKDPVEIAKLFLGTPYLWGGNSGWGIDCSGLVQLAMRACGRECAADSDLQEATMGTLLSPKARTEPGDLIFWQGHVAMAIDAENMIHANAFHMSVVCEPIVKAIDRISRTGGGVVTSKRRP